MYSMDVWKVLLNIDAEALRKQDLLRTSKLASELFRDDSPEQNHSIEQEETFPPKAFSASPTAKPSKPPLTKGKNPFGEPSDLPLEYFLPQRTNPFVSERVSPQDDGSSSVCSFHTTANKYDAVPSPFYRPDEERYWEDDGMDMLEAQVDMSIAAGKTRPQSSYSMDSEKPTRRRSSLLSVPNVVIPSLEEVALKLGQSNHLAQPEVSTKIYRGERRSVHPPTDESGEDSGRSFFSSPRIRRPLERLETSEVTNKKDQFLVSRRHQLELIAEDKYRCRFSEVSRSSAKS